MNSIKIRLLKIALLIICLLCIVFSLLACRQEDTFPSEHVHELQMENVSSEEGDPNIILGKEITIGEYLHFDSYSVEDGLSQSTVFCILQDSKGYMWFGTEDGLNRFDGFTFSVFKSDPQEPNSISSNWIQSIIEDDSGVLWIGTRDGGLNKFDRNLEQFTHYRFTPENPYGISDDEITTLHLGQDGSIWIGTAKGGLNRFDPETEHFVHYQNNPRDDKSISSNSILSIYQTREGILWIGTNGEGLNRYDPINDAFIKYKRDPDDIYSLIDNTVWSIFEDSNGKLWLGTSDGLDQFDSKNEIFTHYRSDRNDGYDLSYDVVQTIYQDSTDSLWIGTYGGGLNYFDPDTQTFSHYQNHPGDANSLSSNIIMSIYQDREGVLWLGTIGGGVNKLDLGRENFTHFKNDPLNSNSLSNNMVRAFFQDDDGTIWVGTMFGGLNRYDRRTHEWQHYQNDISDPSSLSDNFVSEIYRDRSGVLWIGTIHGLDRFDPQTETFAHFDLNPDDPGKSSKIEVSEIFESQDDEFWIGTTDGLYSFDRKNEVWNKKIDFSLNTAKNPYIYTIIEDHSGQLWIGTLGDGLFILDPKTFNINHYQNETGNPVSLSQNFITAMILDEAGDVWIGTNGSGLDRFDQELGTFKNYREIDGLPNDAIYCLLEDNNKNLWVSTNSGLSKFDPKTELFINFDMTDGLQSNEFNAKACMKTRSGEMIFGGINGFNIFIPDAVENNPVVPPIVMISMLNDDEEIKLIKDGDALAEVTLKWPLNSIEFEYAALSYAQPDKNQYAYYLEGFEDSWKAVENRRFGQYTNLPGGSYTLRVKGSNNDGVWNDLGVAVPITVIPPFWQSGWFFVISILSVFGVIYGGYRLRVKNLEERSHELEKQMQQRTEELMRTQTELKQIEMEKAINEERNRLARDLHDSVTQSIYSLTLLAEAGQRMISSGNLSQAKGNQIRLGDIAQQTLQEMRLLVYELRPKVLQREGLAGALEHRLESVERRAGINAQLNMDPTIDIPQEVENELFHISMEALNNALKHAKAKEVKLTIHQDKNSLILIIEDNGRGFDAGTAKSQGGLGLLSMMERTEKIGGSITFQSQTNEGTKIHITVPVSSGDSHFPVPPRRVEDE